MPDFWVKDNETLLMIGDSITDCGRRGNDPPLGSGYARMLTELITAHYPDRNIRYINKGIGGNKVTDLKERWRDDVLYHKPDKLTIKIGINDLHSHLRDPGNGVDPALFESTYDEIMDVTKRELGCPVVLISPFYISTDRSGTTLRSAVLDLLPEYIGVVERMSEKYSTPLVRLHDMFQEQLKYRDADTFCPEPVHPNRTGHLLMAEEVYKVLASL